MSIEATLNVAADKLVGGYQDQLGAYRPITHMYPSSPAVLEINGMTITSNIRHQPIKAYPEPRYIQYFQGKNKWTNKTIHSIAWKCLNLGLKRIDREVVLVKIYNDLLPTRKWQAHDSCCLCEQQETRDYMIHCPAQSQRKWRINTMATSQKQMRQLNTNFNLENTMCCAIAEWFERGHVPLYKYPEKFHDTI